MLVRWMGTNITYLALQRRCKVVVFVILSRVKLSVFHYSRH